MFLILLTHGANMKIDIKSFALNILALISPSLETNLMTNYIQIGLHLKLQKR